MYFHKLTAAAPQPDFRLLVHFNDGQAKLYDMKPLFSQYPVFQALQDTPGLFEQVSIDPGGYGISWNDDLDLSADELFAGGRSISTPFEGLLSLADAAALWDLDESTLRKAISCRRLVNGTDVKKYGKQWLITRAAMEREYGPLEAESASQPAAVRKSV